MDNIEQNQDQTQQEDLQPIEAYWVLREEPVDLVHDTTAPETQPLQDICSDVEQEDFCVEMTDSEPNHTQIPAAQLSPDTCVETAPKKSRFWTTLGKGVALIIVAAIVIGAVILSTSAVTAFLVNSHWENQAALINEATQERLQTLMQRIEFLEKQGINQQESGNLTSGSMTPADVYRMNIDSIVRVTVKSITQDVNGNDITVQGHGSGFITSLDGHIVTNHHVIEDAEDVTVLLSTGEEYPAQILGSDDLVDIAVLKIECKDLSHVTIGSSTAMVIGEQVVAIGNPVGTNSMTLTSGFLSAKDTSVGSNGFLVHMLQTDTAINSGNSGGPLFNMRGEVIGITTSKYSGFSSTGVVIEGMGFAIPIDYVLDFIQQLQSNGKISRGYLGVTILDVSSAMSKEYGIPVGVWVQTVDPGLCAGKAGILAGDVIVDLGGHQIRTVSDLSLALYRFQAGDESVISVFRNGEILTMRVVFDAPPEE